MNKKQVMEDMEEHLRSARIFQNESRYSEAIMELEAALELCEEFKVTRAKSQTLSMLGSIYQYLGYNKRSLESYTTALSLAETDSDSEPSQIADITRHIADVERELGNLKASLTHYEKALHFYRSSLNKDSLGLAKTIRGFAYLKEKMVDYSDARRLWNEAKGIYSKLKVDDGVKECLLRLKKLDLT